MNGQPTPRSGLDPTRLAEVTAVAGAGFRFGSGYRVTNTSVLTAAHLVVDGTVRVRFDAGQPGEWTTAATVDWSDDATNLAVLTIDPPVPAREVGPTHYGRLGDRAAIIDAHTAGFPDWKLRYRPASGTGSGRYRDLHHAFGRVAALSNRRAGQIEITVPPPDAAQRAGTSPWAGMSGAAVWVGERIIGVITAHHPAEGLGRLTATRIDWCLQNAGPAAARLAQLLGLADHTRLPDVVPATVHDGGLGPGRLAEVTATAGTGRRFGSGYRVTNTSVLTAAHLVVDAAVRVRFNAGRPGEWTTDATVEWIDEAADIALLAIRPPAQAEAVAPTRYGRLGDRAAIIDAHTAGFPQWKFRRQAEYGTGQPTFRDLHHAFGSVPVLSNRRAGQIEITVPPPDAAQRIGTSPWAGMSGAAVWVGERIIGVITAHHPAEGLGRLTATRIDWCLQNAGPAAARLAELLGLTDLPDVVRPTPATATAARADQADFPRGKRLALIIATANYDDTALRQLRAPVRDAADLAEVLADVHIGGFAVTSLIDQPARSIGIEVERFVTDCDADDLMLIYLSCHGLVNARGRLYFSATDTVKSSLAATGIDSLWLLELMEECRAREQVLILDCCFSGLLPLGTKSGATAEPGTAIGEKFAGRNRGRGRIVLTASRGSEYSFEGDALPGAISPGSVFTTALVEGIRTGAADSDGDGVITVDNAYLYAFNRVLSLGVDQTPQRWMIGGEGQAILLARTPQPVQEGGR